MLFVSKTYSSTYSGINLRQHALSDETKSTVSFLHVPLIIMTTSSYGNIFRVTGPWCGEFAGHRWIPHTKASDPELWCFPLICVWINGWVNNREAGELRRHRTHYDVIVMCWIINVGYKWLPRSSFRVHVQNIASPQVVLIRTSASSSH